MIRLFSLLFVCSTQLFSCATTAGPGPSPGGGAGQTAAGGSAPTRPGEVAARVSGQSVTIGEIDALAADEIAGKRLEFQQGLYDLRMQALDRLIDERLLEAEAKGRGISVAALTEAEVDRGVETVSDDEVVAFYARNQSEMPKDIETMRPIIVEYLTDKRKAQRYQGYVAELRAAAEVQIVLSPPRMKVEAKGPARGPADAPIVIVEFSDFQCPYCHRSQAAIDQVMAAYEGRVRLVFRHYPLSFHDSARPAAEASLCADAQGLFWPMHDRLFAGYADLSADTIAAAAGAIDGMNMVRFNACVRDGEKAAAVRADMEAAGRALVTGTPAFFINGIKLEGAQPFERFKAVIDTELIRLRR